MLKDFGTLIRMWNQLRYIMTEKQKRQSAAIFILIIGGALFETLGVSAILPFIQSIMEPEELVNKWYIAVIVRTLNLKDTYSIVYLCGVFISLVYVIKNVYLFASSRIQSKFSWRFQKNLSTKMLASYMKRPYVYFLDINSAEIIRTLSTDVFGVLEILQNGFRFFSEFFTVVLIGIFTISVDAVMALQILLIAGLCFFGITFFFKNRLSKIGAKQRDANVERTKCAYQAVNGYKEVQVMQRADCFVEAYEEAYEGQRKLEVSFETISALPERLIETVCIIGLILVVCLRLASGVAVEEFVPKLSVFAVAAFRILPSVSRMTGYLNNVVYYRPMAEAVSDELHAVEEYRQIIDRQINKEVEEQSDEEYSFRDKVEVRNIRWKYPRSDKYVLQDVSITIEKGDSVALIGASGAGKTTLADVILGLLHPEGGAVSVDGIGIETIPRKWSRLIGYVPQVVFLVDDTIRNNIAFGLRQEEINDEMVWSALEQAQLKEFVQGLPNELNTIVGERGVKFSGGQRQRIAIARALYYNPDILVLDEATSALDNETESAVMESIEALQGHKTLIIVAHRLTTIRKCNKIYEITDGHAILREKEEVLKGK